MVLLERDQLAQSGAQGDETECQASAGGEGVGEARSRSTVTFNEQGDYVLAAVCRLETKDLVRDNYLSLELGDISLFWQERNSGQCPASRPAAPGGEASGISFPHPTGGGVLSSNQPRRTGLQSMD